MRQKRFCEYYGLPCRHTKTFLHLPFSVRRHIYVLAGLTVDDDIVLERQSPPDLYYMSDGREQPYPVVFGLLQTCRAIHEEVLGILLAENNVIVSDRDCLFGLRYLLRLLPRVCSQLCNLYIHLHLIGPPDDTMGDFARWSLCKGRPPLSKRRIEIWQQTASHILSHANSDQLRLHIICDTREGEMCQTEAALKPVHDHPGSLKSCHIRLYPHKNPRLSRRAASVARRAMGLAPDLSSSSSSPFPFLSLPVKLRLKILQYTDLVTPWNELTWQPERGFSISWGGYERQEQSAATHWGRSSPSFNPWEFSTGCDTPSSYETGYFCNARNAGFSPSCSCWRPPSALTRGALGRIFHAEAIHVLYSANRVILLYDADEDNDGGQVRKSNYHLPLPGPPAASSLTSSLRDLEIVFPSFPPHREEEPSSSTLMLRPGNEWSFAATIDHLREHHGNLAGLTLSVYMRVMTGTGTGTGWGGSDDHRHDGGPGLAGFLVHGTTCSTLGWSLMGEDEEEQRIEGRGVFLRAQVGRVLESLRGLREGGLERLFVFLEWDRFWSPGVGRPEDYTWGSSTMEEGMVAKAEVALEREVMGEGYDSYELGKGERYPSQWMLACSPERS